MLAWVALEASCIDAYAARASSMQATNSSIRFCILCLYEATISDHSGRLAVRSSADNAFAENRPSAASDSSFPIEPPVTIRLRQKTDRKSTRLNSSHLGIS